MGQAVSGLTQHDVEEVSWYCNNMFSQREIESLYERFRTLDKGRKGYIHADELLGIPELSINPILSRLGRLFESVNFKEFVKLLAPFSARASRDDKLEAMFLIYDVDGDGVISRDDMGLMLKQLGGASLRDEDVSTLVDQVMYQACSTSGLDLKAFKDALKDADLSGMVVVVPVE